MSTQCHDFHHSSNIPILGACAWTRMLPPYSLVAEERGKALSIIKNQGYPPLAIYLATFSPNWLNVNYLLPRGVSDYCCCILPSQKSVREGPRFSDFLVISFRTYFFAVRDFLIRDAEQSLMVQSTSAESIKCMTVLFSSINPTIFGSNHLFSSTRSPM